MGPWCSDVRLPIPCERGDLPAAKMRSLTPDLARICTTWAKKHIWCGALLGTLFLVSLVYLVGQKPEVCPQPDGRRPQRCTELEKDISGLRVTLSNQREAAEKEKVKAQVLLDETQMRLRNMEEERGALRARLADSNQTLAWTQKLLDEATEGGRRMRVQMEEAGQSLGECQQREKSCQDQLHTLQKTIASQEAEVKRHQAEKEAFREEIERHQHRITMQNSEATWSNQRLREYEERIRHLKDQLARQKGSVWDCEDVTSTVLVLGGLLLLIALCKCCGSICS